MKHLFERLAGYADVGHLTTALRSLCARYGSVSRLHVLTAHQQGKRQALCFLRMDTPDQERHLMRELGIQRFSGDLVLVVDLQPQSSLAGHASSSHAMAFAQ
jgi:hypothetical protein